MPDEGLPPLAGVLVLDLSRVLSGPYCTAMLADLGARVIKIEAPGGDDARHLGPFRDGESVYFAILNRGKQSLTLDLKDEDDLGVLRHLAARADVLVENFRPGVMARLGLSYEELAALNPRLIYTSISGFGQTGPESGRPAYDLIVQAESGLMNITGWPDGPPTRVGESLGDITAGVLAAFAINGALYARERDGRGSHLDVSMLEGLLALQVTAISQLNASGQAPTRVGNRHPVSTPFDTYQASDGMVVLAVANEPGFIRLAELIGLPELPRDPRFASDQARTLNKEQVRSLIEGWTATRTVDQVVQAAIAMGVAAAPILNLQEALASPQVESRNTVATISHPRLGELRYIPQPVRMSGRPRPVLSPSPALDADRARLLEGLSGIGLSDDPGGEGGHRRR
ncbi:MAG TPA: CoA transferase [Candidatus Dormibacteraeota bacterium]|nr:CoA transferase [Candidatus Dormibacteraeota bacterium]HVB78291.1 CoA transferase [Candidatus Nitrosotalea sp.]